jgi:hypothetical protein
MAGVMLLSEVTQHCEDKHHVMLNSLEYSSAFVCSAENMGNNWDPNYAGNFGGGGGQGGGYGGQQGGCGGQQGGYGGGGQGSQGGY